MAGAMQPTEPSGQDPNQPAPSIEDVASAFPLLEILGCAGRGGMGIVYKARQKTLDRLVALKLLAPERVADTEFAERFGHEAKALAALSHPNIVTIYDFGQAGQFYYLLMEFVDGANLRQLLRAQKFTPEEALAIVPPICEALQYAHEHGVVHRDIKPENLLLDKEGRVKIADFGIAKMLRHGTSEIGVAETQPAGTPQYMAPEQKERRVIDHRADIYSLGVVFYEMLTGELPAPRIEAPSSLARGVRIDVRIDEIVLRALEKEPQLRIQTAAEFRTRVQTIAGTVDSTRDATMMPTAEAGRLERVRWQLVGYSALMAIGALAMGSNLNRGGLVISAWGILFFVAVTVMSVFSNANVAKVKAARQVALIDAVGILSAAMGCAAMTPNLPRPWPIAIGAVCAYGIVACLLQLANLGPFRSALFISDHWGKPGLWYAAYYGACFSSFASIVFWWIASSLTPASQKLAPWLLLIVACGATGVGLAARKSRRGGVATIVGGINFTIWTLFLAAGIVSQARAAGIPELVQDETLDIQPDGEIRFKTLVAAVNRSAMTLDKDQFRNSSFVHVERIFDGHGSLLDFETLRGAGDGVSYRVSLKEPVAPGAKVTIVTEDLRPDPFHDRTEWF
jgi:predicted Ser/Thr protein kinase